MEEFKKRHFFNKPSAVLLHKTKKFTLIPSFFLLRQQPFGPRRVTPPSPLPTRRITSALFFEKQNKTKQVERQP